MEVVGIKDLDSIAVNGDLLMLAEESTGTIGRKITIAELLAFLMGSDSMANALAGKANTSHKHTKSQITDFPTSMPASDVYDWAKASTKPSYSMQDITGLIPTLNLKLKRTVFELSISASYTFSTIDVYSICYFSITNSTSKSKGIALPSSGSYLYSYTAQPGVSKTVGGTTIYTFETGESGDTVNGWFFRIT